ncbi:TIGR02680 family protein [Nocardia sp. NPDC051030]|uniref:TIGR02680 family protein n=1 Tax=Nocardia sp. NPDC051030 TaxID=3155162 RepID=UPI00342AD17E
MTVTTLRFPTADLGADRAVRWTPTRAGVLNVWRYYDEIFEFHDGSLLLRGPNGSGKSKALELLLPFLFDANLRANRLSTFGTGERTMHWNLMGEGATGTTRVGYVWLEFRLPGEPDRWFTCGARLQASSHTTTVHPDYFTTELRIDTESGRLGPEFITLSADNRPLTKTALEERIGERGTVHPNAGDYRNTIRSALFPGLNEQRYDALITAILQLRTPKLSQRLDPALLSSLLSKALPPLGQEEIADLAEGFERLDAQRERLARLEEEVTATRTLARHQRTYAQRVLRSGAAALLTTTSEVDKLSAKAKESAEQYDAVSERIVESGARIHRLEQERAAADARKEGLLESEAYKQGLELEQLRRETVKEEGRAAALRGNADSFRAVAEDDAGKREQAEELERRHERIVAGHALETGQAAARVGMPSVFDELSAALGSDHVRSLLRGAVSGKQQQIRAINKALDGHERAVDLRKQAEEDLDSAREQITSAEDRRSAAVESRERALEDLRDLLRIWGSACRELTFDDAEALAEHADIESDVLALVNAAVTEAKEEIKKRETLCQTVIDSTSGECGALVSERDRLVAEHDIPPAMPPWRTTDRTRMPGAPLWRLVDFDPAVTDSARAGIEAALEASGLLDAWVGPTGEIAGHDLFADPDALPPVTGRSLADIVIPLPDTVIDAAIVQRLLAGIAFDDHLPATGIAAIGADGTWRLGNLTGSWSKEHASYVGALTRQRARERRIGELDLKIAGLTGTLTRLDRELQELVARRQIVDAERASLPSREEVDSFQLKLSTAESDLRAAESVVRQRVDALTDRERAVRAALLELTGLAAENGLPAEREALDELATGIDTFAGQAEVWLDACGLLRSARESTAHLADQAARSQGLATDREAEAGAAEAEHARLAAKLAEIESAIGLDYREVLDRISKLRKSIKDLESQMTGERATLTKLVGRRGSLETEKLTDAAAHDLAVTERDRRAERFRRLGAGIFPADSQIPDLNSFRNTLAGSEGVRAARDAARMVAAAWPDLPHSTANIGDALHRLSNAVHECRTALSARADLDLETDEDVQVFSAVVDGLHIGAAELQRLLRTEADQAHQEITEQERRLFDRTLTGDTRRHLAARIRQANDLVDGMNARLERVRTASNVSVRIVWQIAPDLPAGTKAARDLLLMDPVRLTEADHESLHRFLRDRIEEAKADNTATSWEQQLAQVFDYTAWHRFVVKIDRGHGEQPLTKKLHDALSGGEKAIALHLPLFAAVAAHYQAAPRAPRLILLDEVFVGVDTVNRGQVFALLSALDLDLVLTSDHEWCTYSELRGIAIHQILTGDGDDAVTTARFTWDGHELRATQDSEDDQTAAE